MYAQCEEALDHGRQAGTTEMPTSQLMPLIHATQQQPPLSVDVPFRDRPCDMSTPNKTFQIAMSIEIASNNIARVKDLLCHSDVGLPGSMKSPVVIAIEYQRHDILRQLLDDSKVDANVKDIKGHTPLHLAIIYDDLVAVRILLEHPRVDINCLTAAGDSPLLLAAKTFDGNSARSQILQVIVSTPDVVRDLRDQMGRTALWHAVNTGNIPLIIMLSQCSHTDLGVADNEGITPSSRATLQDTLMTVRISIWCIEHSGQWGANDRVPSDVRFAHPWSR